MKCHDGTANKSIHFLAFSYRLLYIFYDVRVVDLDNGSVEMNDKKMKQETRQTRSCVKVAFGSCGAPSPLVGQEFSFCFLSD